MNPEDLHQLSEEQLVSFLHDRLWRHAHVAEGRFGQDEYDLIIAAWKLGDPGFRDRLDRAIGHLLKSAVLSPGGFSPGPVLPLVARLRTRSAASPLMLFVEAIDHRDCGEDSSAAERHRDLLSALAASQSGDALHLRLWRDQLDRVLSNRASPPCVRAVTAHLAHVAPEEVLPHLPQIVELVAQDKRPDRFTLLLRPFLVSNRSQQFVTRLGQECCHLSDAVRQELAYAVTLIVKDDGLAGAFARGCGLVKLDGAREVVVEIARLLRWSAPRSAAPAEPPRRSPAQWDRLRTESA